MLVLGPFPKTWQLCVTKKAGM